MDVPQQIEQLRAEHGDEWLQQNCWELSRWIELPHEIVKRLEEASKTKVGHGDNWRNWIKNFTLHGLATERFSSVDDVITFVEHYCIDEATKKNLYRVTCYRCGRPMKQNRYIGITRYCPCTDRPS